MANNKYLIPVWETVTTSWLKVSGTKGSMWAGFGMIFLVAFAFGIIGGIAQMIHPALNSLVSFIGQIFVFLMHVGLLYIGIQRAADLPFNYRMVFRGFELNLAIKLILVYILQVLILLPAIILFMLPVFMNMMMTNGGMQPSTPLNALVVLLYVAGTILMVALSIRIVLAMGFVLDKNARPLEAIKLSFAATKDNVWRLIGIYIIQTCIMIIGMIPLGIGVIWTIPLIFIIYGTVYKRLLVNVNQ